MIKQKLKVGMLLNSNICNYGDVYTLVQGTKTFPVAMTKCDSNASKGNSRRINI